MSELFNQQPQLIAHFHHAGTWPITSCAPMEFHMSWIRVSKSFSWLIFQLKYAILRDSYGIVCMNLIFQIYVNVKKMSWVCNHSTFRFPAVLPAYYYDGKP